nr:MAG TPA_asm: hypothetical protein [Caudoviricetes sp.]
MKINKVCRVKLPFLSQAYKNSGEARLKAMLPRKNRGFLL